MRRSIGAYLLMGIMSGIILLMCAFIGSFVYPLKYKEEIESLSQSYGLEPGFVASVIYAESGFKRDAISKKGAIGLMQLMPSTAESFYAGDDFDESMLKEPRINIEIGCRFLAYLFQKYQDKIMVLACYNAGETQARAWRGDYERLALKSVTFAETRNYISKIIRVQKIYNNKF